MEKFELNGLILEIVTEGDKVTNFWKGQSRDMNPIDFLMDFLEKLVTTAKGKDLEINFCNLRIMNSTTIRIFINYMTRLNSEGISTTLVYDNNSFWQKSCFNAITTLATTFPCIKILPKK